MTIPTKSYEDISEKYSAAIRWMLDIGVKIGPGRTVHYEKIVDYWTVSYKTASAVEAKKAFPDVVSSMFEVHDFIDIYESFQKIPIDQLTLIVKKLNLAVNGPINASEENANSTKARNFLFEAVVAAKVNNPNKGVLAMLDAESDTGISIDGNKLWVECKRVSTSDNIASNVQKASRQLEEILKEKVGSGHRGIVALDVSKIINPQDQLFVSNNDSDLLESVEQMMDKFIKEYSSIWQRIYMRRNRKIIGTIIRFAFMSSSEARNILVHTSQWGVNPRLAISRSDENIQRFLATSLKGTV